MGRSKHSAEFKEQAVREVIDQSKTIAEVARTYGLIEQTLGNWVNAYKREHAGALPERTVTEAERDELVRLRKEIRDLKLEREFLA